MARLNSLRDENQACGLVFPRSDVPHRYSVFGASELVRVNDDGTVPIRMVNPSTQPVKIFRRTRLADFGQVDNDIAAYELHDPEHFEVSSVSCNPDEHKLPQDDYWDFS